LIKGWFLYFAGVQGLVHKISSLITKNKRFREPHSRPYGSEAVHFLYSQQPKIVKQFSNEGDLILIPFAGSGSECVSAARNKRDFIAFEINPKYITIAEQRLGGIKS